MNPNDPRHPLEEELPAEEESGATEFGSAETSAPSTELEALRRERDQLNEQLVRMTAEFQNFRRRTETQLQDRIRQGLEGLLSDLVHVLDAMDAAFGATASSLADDKAAAAVLEGFEQIRALLSSVLSKAGLRRIEAVGKRYDPRFHEALMNVPSADHPAETVIGELRAGYTILDRVFRPAQVSVSTGAPDQTSSN